MAYANGLSTNTFFGLGDRLASLIATLRAERARRKIFRDTYRELSMLSPRELADLGLSRAELRRVAYQAAYEV